MAKQMDGRNLNHWWFYLDIQAILEPSISMKVKVLVAQSCLTLCNPVDCGLPGPSVHGILQARILKWVDIPFSRESSQPGSNWVSCTVGRFFTIWATKEPIAIDNSVINILMIYVNVCHIFVIWRWKHTL